MNIRYKYSLWWVGGIFLISCNNTPSKNHGPIVLGDSSAIVTESDPKRLQDLVTDLTPDIPTNTTIDTPNPAPAAVDTAKKTETTKTQPAAFPAGNGLKAEFKDVSVMIPGINA